MRIESVEGRGTTVIIGLAGNSGGIEEDMKRSTRRPQRFTVNAKGT